MPAWWTRFGGNLESPTALCDLLLDPGCDSSGASTVQNSFLISLYLHFVVGDGLASAQPQVNGVGDAYATVVLHKCGVSIGSNAFIQKVSRVWADWCALAKNLNRNLGKMDTFLHKEHLLKPVQVCIVPVVDTVILPHVHQDLSRLSEAYALESQCRIQVESEL